MTQDNFDYRPAPFWFLNHKLEKGELKRQIKLMKAAGVSGFFIHPRAGLLTPYGSDEWFDMVGYIIGEAEKEGLKAWLYDEDPFPSGISGGRVVFDNPEYAARSIQIKKYLPDENGRVSGTVGKGRLLSAFAVRVGVSGDIEEKRDINGSIGMIRPMYFKSRWNSSYYAGMINEKPYPHFRAETFYPELRIDTVLGGEGWVVYAVIAETVLADGKFGVLPDNLNKECVRAFINYTHEKYLKIAGDKFGRTVPGIFTDEPAAGGYLPWTGTFEREFLDEKGYRIEENYFHLIDTFGEESRKVRNDYWSVIRGMFKESFYGQISSWCRENGLMFAGHVICEEDPVAQVITGGNASAFQEYFDIPGFDIIGENLGDRRYPGLIFGGKLISSAAHRQGKRRVLSECMACNSFNFGPEGMMKFAGWLFAIGITWLVPHGFYYSNDGDRKYDAGKSFFFQDPYFGEFRKFADYTGRMGAMLAGASHMSSTCLLYPVSAFRQMMPAEKKTAAELRGQLYSITRTLFEEHIEFDILDDDAILGCNMTGGVIMCGEENYTVVIIPDNTYLPGTYLSTAKVLEDNGVKVVYADNGGKFDVSILTDNNAVCSDIAGEQSASDARNIMSLRKKRGNDSLIYMFNNSQHPGVFSIAGEKSNHCYKYDPGEDKYLDMCPAGGKVCFGLQGYGSILLVFTDDEISDAAIYSIPSDMKPSELEHEINPMWDYIPPGGCICNIKTWDISLNGLQYNERVYKQPFCLMRDIAGTEYGYLKKLNPKPIFDSAKQVGSIYPVKAEFKAVFTIPAEVYDKSGGLYLLMENDTLQGDCKIYINGKELSTNNFVRSTVYDYFNLTAEVRKYLKAGCNEIDVLWPSAGEFDGLKSAMYII